MTEYDAGPTVPLDVTATGLSVGKAVQWMGGLASLALIAGLGVWGYRLIIRDVQGVPVVMALEGPVRVAPEEPGGVLAAHQGLAVNAIPGEEDDSVLADELILAPEPLALDDEDLPVADLRPEPSPAAEPEVVAQAGEEDADQGPGDGRAAALALADSIAEGLEPMAPLAEEEKKPIDLAESVREAVEEVRVAEAGPAPRMPRPYPRPARIAARIAARMPDPTQVMTVAAVRDVPAPAAADPVELAVDEIPAGTRLVQLGAFDSPDVAREQWVRIGGKFEEYFDGKRRVVQKAVSGGKTFYRLRAEGFTDLADARRFCSALTAGRADCIPVLVR